MEENYFSGEYCITARVDMPGEFTTCRVILTADRIQVLPSESDEAALSIPFHQIDGSLFGDYLLQLQLSDGAVVGLRGFGAMSDAFYEDYRQARNTWLSTALLLTDRKPLGIFEGSACLPGRDPVEAQIRIFPASVGILLNTETAENLPFSEIQRWSFHEDNYAFVFRMESGAEISIRNLGAKTEEFHRQLKTAHARCTKRAEDRIAGLFPELSLLQRRGLSRILRDGMPTRRGAMDEISPLVWQEMEKNLLANEFLSATYDWLKERATKPDGVLLGYKDTFNPAATTAEDQTESPDVVFWFLCMIKASYGTALAFEITSDEGHATYFFQADPPADADSICRDLRRIQFRREPVYMTEIACRNAKRYELLFAIRKIEALQRLRKQFLGRAMHTSFASWVSQAEGILSGSAA